MQVLSIGKERLADIWELNHQFLALGSNPETCMAIGLPVDLHMEIGKLSAEELAEVSRTDMLLFSVETIPSVENVNVLHSEVAEFYRQLGLTFRDIAMEDMGVAASKLGLAKDDCQTLLRLRLADARNYFVDRPLRVAAIGTTQFRVLTALRSPSDRTQYALLAANDD